MDILRVFVLVNGNLWFALSYIIAVPSLTVSQSRVSLSPVTAYVFSSAEQAVALVQNRTTVGDNQCFCPLSMKVPAPSSFQVDRKEASF